MMAGSPRQDYLEKARAALAAREGWRDTFHTTTPKESRGSEATRSVDPLGSACDKSDQSDQSPSVRDVDGAEVAWRVEAMRPRVPPTGPIPTMYACQFPSPTPNGSCLSCGEMLTPGNQYHCEPCVLAAWQVLREVRGDVGNGRPKHRG